MARDDDGFMALFGALVNSMGGGSDRGNMFPQSDAEDFAKGFVLSLVRCLARRAGQQVEFVQECGNPCCWYWQMPDGSRVYHWDRYNFELIARTNGNQWEGEFHGDAGACPSCGNTHTNGGTIKA